MLSFIPPIIMDRCRVKRWTVCKSIVFATFSPDLKNWLEGKGLFRSFAAINYIICCFRFFSLLSSSPFSCSSMKKKPNVIHAHWLIPQGFLAVLMKWIFGVPVIVTAHGADVFSLREGIFIWLKKLIVNNADRIVTVSNSLAKMLIEDTRSSIQPEVIPMGVDAVTLFTTSQKRFNQTKIWHSWTISSLCRSADGEKRSSISYRCDGHWCKLKVPSPNC